MVASAEPTTVALVLGYLLLVVPRLAAAAACDLRNPSSRRFSLAVETTPVRLTKSSTNSSAL